MMEPTFLTKEQVLFLHELAIQEHGGSLGLRDEGLFESALEMPKAGFGGTYFHETIYHMGAAYLFHMVKNHPFVDGNKRIGLLCAVAFFGMNDIKLTLSNQRAIDLTMKLASESVFKEEIAKIFEENSVLVDSD